MSKFFPLVAILFLFLCKIVFVSGDRLALSLSIYTCNIARPEHVVKWTEFQKRSFCKDKA